MEADNSTPWPTRHHGQMKIANLALKFALELCAFAALAYWGATAADGVLAVALAIAAPGVAIGLWSVFAAPRSERRLSTWPRLAFELGVFAVAVAALAVAGWAAGAVVLAALVVINTAALLAAGQWEA
jgi:Protein of unknown function (DUF2568)